MVEEKMERIRIGDKIDSNHHPIEEVWLREETERKGGTRGERRGRRGVWDEEGKRFFKQKMEEVMEEGKGLEERLEEIGRKVREAMRETEKVRGGGNRRGRGWWDEECKEMKWEVRKELREWRRRGEGEGELYRRKKREYNDLCRWKKEEDDRWETKAVEVRREGKVWEIVNRERRRRARINERIGTEEWREYFMALLRGVEGKVVTGYRDRRGEEDGEEGIGKEEFRRTMWRLKNGKAAGIDEIPGEAWKYGGEGLEKWAWEFCNRIWEGEGWPEEWREGVIVPILKKREGKEMKDYRGGDIVADYI